MSRLSATPVVDGGTYTSGGGLTLAADVREAQGRTLVCGVWAQSRQQSALTSLAERQVIGTGSVFLGRERIANNLLFMQQVDPAPTYGGKEAGCLLVDRPWQAADATRETTIRIPRQIVARQDGSKIFGSGVVVWFEQTGPGAGVR
ncbi:MAG: hypothetical protein AAFW87_07315 [Pseudomonadota bacterium]